MARRSKISPEQIRASLFTTCTACGYKVPPSEVLYVDGKRCRCPQFGADFEPESKCVGGAALGKS